MPTRDGRRFAARALLKHPLRDGAVHVVFDPLDLIARLAALVHRSGISARCTSALNGVVREMSRQTG